MPDGTIVSKGGDIAKAVRVSLLPMGPVPRHDFVGLSFTRRFMRFFKRSTVGGFDKKKYFAELEARLSDSRKSARAARGSYLPPPIEDAKPQKRDEAVQCIVTKDCRVYVRHSDGSVLITPADYELYL